jgi:tripartite-type tricarboxylate transporter receptor subunit TctC
MTVFARIGVAFLAATAFAGPALAQKYPDKPVELVCTTSPGSGISFWCQVLAAELPKPEYLGVPVNVIYKSGGSQHEPVLYVAGKPADGYTIMHVSASYYGYFHLPHYTKSYDDFHLLARMIRLTYGVAVRCDNPYGIKTWNDLVTYAKQNPRKLAMGSNKVGSGQHRHQLAMLRSADVDIRFVPYQGDGDTIKDVVGGHVPVGMAQPRGWGPHIAEGTICPLLLMNDKRLEGDPNWKNVPNVREVGLNYDIPHQWEGFMVKKGTPPEIMDTLAAALKKVSETSPAYKEYLTKSISILVDVNTDRKWLDEDMYKNMPEVKKFMIDHKIIPAS